MGAKQLSPLYKEDSRDFSVQQSDRSYLYRKQIKLVSKSTEIRINLAMNEYINKNHYFLIYFKCTIFEER